jgi:large subunit ribosomal protein L22
MPGPKTNEHRPEQAPGTRAVLRYARVSAFKVREVLDLIRNKPVGEARDILRFVERDAAILAAKLLDSAVANATNNDEMVEEELYVSACFADEGTTIKRWRPRARGRATRIRKRTCHITVIVSRLPEDQLSRLRARQAAEQAARRARRVAGARKAAAAGPGRLRRRGRGGEEGEPTASEVAEAEEEEGIVDQQAEALASLETEETPEELEAAEAKAEAIAETPAGQIAEAEEEAGIVDQQAEAVAEAEAEEAAEAAEAPEDAEAPKEKGKDK